MKLTSQEEYGLRCLLQIAGEPERISTIAGIAKREGLSTAYVAKLVRTLRKAGLLRSVRGQKGGFELAHSPDDINVGVVLNALGGRLYSESFCVTHSGCRGVCVHQNDCALRSLWSALDAAVQSVLRRTQLRHLMQRERQLDVWLGEVTGGKFKNFNPDYPCE